jgi:ribonuclease P protein component
MLKKILRLNEREVKKVLIQKKPFFSYGIVLNHARNMIGHMRCGIVISAKSVENNVNRVFFRRLFYDIVQKEANFSLPNDVVFVVKKDTKLEKRNTESIQQFQNDVKFLIKKWQETVKK